MTTNNNNQTDRLTKKIKKLHQEILKSCIEKLKSEGEDCPERWIFVFLRSVAIPKEGRASKFWKIPKRAKPYERKKVKEYLQIQYQIAPELRTYNELLVLKDENDPFSISFSFQIKKNDSIPEPEGEIHFNYEQIQESLEMKSCKNFKCLSLFDCLDIEPHRDNKDNKKEFVLKDYEKQKLLNQNRESISLNKKIRETFNLDTTSTAEKDRLFVFPDEVRYAIQILMLWSRSMHWKYIETHHSGNIYHNLSGLVISVCSSEEKLTDKEREKIIGIIKEKSKQLDDILIQKSGDLPKNPLRIKRVKDNLSIFIRNEYAYDGSDYNLLWSGDDAFCVIEYIKNLLFSQTFEGIPGSYSFILGHPGFIKRPKSFTDRFYSIKDISKNRELSDGLLDRLNVIDIFNHPQPDAFSTLEYLPIPFPEWAKKWDDIEQASGAALRRLSFGHPETIVIGLHCKQVMMVYRTGELSCVFDGAWKAIQSWNDIVKRLGIPPQIADTSKSPSLKDIYRILVDIAYGPAPRSIIVGYIHQRLLLFKEEVIFALALLIKSGLHRLASLLLKPPETVDEFINEKETKGQIASFNSYGEWSTITSTSSLELSLLQASKTDGAILISPDKSGLYLLMKSRARINIQSYSESQSSGTGDATAAAMAKEWGIVTMKVSHDGGLKVRYNGPECGTAHESSIL